jgi:hypothetical protein
MAWMPSPRGRRKEPGVLDRLDLTPHFLDQGDLVAANADVAAGDPDLPFDVRRLNNELAGRAVKVGRGSNRRDVDRPAAGRIRRAAPEEAAHVLTAPSSSLDHRLVVAEGWRAVRLRLG